LVSLGVIFRFLAAGSLLHALDREIQVQGAQFIRSQDEEDDQLIPTPFFANFQRQGSPSNKEIGPSREVVDRPDNPRTKALLVVSSTESTIQEPPSSQKQYRIVHKQDVPMPGRTSNLFYQDLPAPGKMDASLYRTLSLTEGPFDAKTTPEANPWDWPAFRKAMKGEECYSTAMIAGSPWRVLSMPRKKEGKVVGALQLATPLKQVSQDVGNLTRTLLMVLPMALFVAAVAGVYMTGHALRPVKELSQAAAKLTPEQLGQRLPIRADDEFDELASTFNRALDRVETAFEERERAIEQLRRFTADASHELRTPLTTIKIHTGVALAAKGTFQEQLYALRQIDRAADRMTSLVQGLLLLARSDAGQIALDLRPVLLESVLTEVIDTLTPGTKAVIRLDVRTPSLQIRGDQESLYRVFLNLLENAIRHTPAEGEIRVVIDRLNEQAIVSVQDTGCGIDPVHLSHLGERFYRADTGRNRQHGGVGLGLAICQTIVTQHQGTMSIDSMPGVGTTVTVCLPYTGPCGHAYP
jgi:two-component system OmpR family sensor kinase